MTDEPGGGQAVGPAGSLSDRLERAALVLVGALALGPLLPALFFAGLMALARLVPDGPTSVPMLPFGGSVLQIVESAYLNGGGLAALAAGLASAIIVAVRGSIGTGWLAIISAVSASAVVAIEFWDRWQHGLIRIRQAAPLAMAFVLIALVSARLLHTLARMLDILPRHTD